MAVRTLASRRLDHGGDDRGSIRPDGFEDACRRGIVQAAAEWHVVDLRVIRHTWIEAAPAIDDRDRLLAADEIVRLESAEALIGRGDDDERGIDERGIDRFGDESLVAEGAAGAVRCEWVIANHSHARLRHGKCEGDALGFLDDVSDKPSTAAVCPTWSSGAIFMAMRVAMDLL